jgi:aconitate hydratase
VLSGNRNFEGRVNPHVKANYLASPMLVVVYALAGSMKIDIAKDPIGYGKNDKPVYLKDLWPTNKEIADAVRKSVTPAAFKKRYKDVFTGDQLWRKVKIAKGQTYMWDKASTYVQNPPYFVGMSKEAGNKIADVVRRGRSRSSAFHHHRSSARRLDQKDGPPTVPDQQGRRLVDFNSYGARRALITR